MFDIDAKRARLAEIEVESRKEEFWKDLKRQKVVLKEKSALEDVLAEFDALAQRIADLEALVEIAEEADGGEDTLQALDDLQRELPDVKKALGELERKSRFTEPHDSADAIVEIHPGAGGTEAQDWAQMLLRMYLMWVERKGFSYEMLDMLEGEEAGIKSATFLVKGQYAYGYLKAESGVHRLVRISPFDASARRHTSFASVHVYPDIETEIDIELKDEDLKIETTRASGPGGQHVNKVETAVRIVHIPTGITVQCQSERSQHRNKEAALKILKARLYELERKKQQEFLEKEFHSKKKEIGWGSQIRSYILHPYKLVKDHRTGYETSSVDAVLDGELDEFIEAYLAQQRG
ncbi:MAG TPA: peptide chain release factor 2 [Proteobacteria bacterium]|nr:peptide chain release factor 2 [Pseudomonadota bacterium]